MKSNDYTNYVWKKARMKMSNSFKSKSVKPDGKIEFDVLVDGKYQRRVSEGILFEDAEFGQNIAISCHKLGVFKAIYGLKNFLKENDLVEEYENFERIMSLDVDAAFAELMKKLEGVAKSNDLLS